MKCASGCSCCRVHENTIQALQLSIQSLQQQMLDEVNSYRKLLQMTPLTGVDSPFIAPSKTPIATSTTVCPSIDTAPPIPAILSRSSLESMPPEILDRIASFIIGPNILRLCHAVRYYKYISQAMFDFAHGLKGLEEPRILDVYFWPCIYLRLHQAMEPFERTPPIPISHLHVLQNLTNIVTRHGGHAMIDDLAGMDTILGALPDNLEVLITHAKPSAGMDDFFDAMYNTKKNIWELSFEDDYFERCKSDPASFDMTANWLVKLPIHKLKFLGYVSLPTEILDVLHLMPMLSSLQIPTLEDCDDAALTDCKSLEKLSISNVFDGEEGLEDLVEQLLDILKPTTIQEVAIYLPSIWQTFLRDDLRVLIAPLFLEHGWLEYPERIWSRYPSMHFICRRCK